MTDSAVLQKLAEIERLQAKFHAEHHLDKQDSDLLDEHLDTLRSVVEPILAEREKYKSAIKKHLCANDAADWLACSGGHEQVCALCSMDKGIIPDQPGCFHEILKLTKERVEAAENALRVVQAERDEHESWRLSNELAAKTEHARANGLEAENDKLRELLRRKDDAMAVALDRLGGHGGVVAAIAEALSHSGPYTEPSFPENQRSMTQAEARNLGQYYKQMYRKVPVKREGEA